MSLTPAFPTRDSSLRGTRQVWSWCSLTDSGPCSAGGGLAGGTRDILIQEGVGTAAELRTGLREQGAQRIFPRGGSEEAGWPWCCEQELPGTRTLTEEDQKEGTLVLPEQVREETAHTLGRRAGDGAGPGRPAGTPRAVLPPPRVRGDL